MGVLLTELVNYLDDYLCIKEIPDWKQAHNGLQVEGTREVNRVSVAVDSCLSVIEQAAANSSDLLIVHHGLFWGSTVPLTGVYYKKISTLIHNHIALYSSHTPLDAHPEVGNNACLTSLLGLRPSGTWGKLDGVELAVYADCNVDLVELTDRLSASLNVTPIVAFGGPQNAKRVGILTGSGADWISKAKEAGIDTLITGEGPHHTFLEAEEQGINLLYAGHYATETLGVQALAKHLETKFALTTHFIDHPTGL